MKKILKLIIKKLIKILPSNLQKKINQKKLKKLNTKINPSNTQRKIIANLCRGDCIEIGALSSPGWFPFATSIKYADIHKSNEAKEALEKIGYFGYHQRKFVDVSIIFNPEKAPLEKITSNSIDTIYSSHSLEHSPNPIAALIDYLRVVKKNGIVYTIIPNKNFTYDKKRKSTDINYLIQKYHSNNWSYNIEEYRDVFLNTESHEVYDNKSDKDIINAFKENSGHHHIYVYDEKNTLQLINFVLNETSGKIIYFDASNNNDIHFAISKQ
tara:strand:+ start:567 stop:1373 length:807 start_codon:yes stop_codon:yes gene_type:complete